MIEFSEKLVNKLIFVLSEAIRIFFYALLSAILVLPISLVNIKGNGLLE